jgi:hypothetical protein
MPKKLLATTITIATILALVVGIQVIEIAKANPMGMKPSYILVTIQSPKNNSHYSNPVILNFTAEHRTSYISQSSPANHNIYYKIDGGESQRISEIEVINYKEIRDEINPKSPIADYPYYLPYAVYSLKGSVVLPNLTKGWHNLTVGSTIIEFYVEFSNDIPNNIPAPSNSPSTKPTQLSTVNPNRAFHEKLIAIQQSYTLGVIIVAVVISLGVLFYFKRRKGKP